MTFTAFLGPWQSVPRSIWPADVLTEKPLQLGIPATRTDISRTKERKKNKHISLFFFKANTSPFDNKWVEKILKSREWIPERRKSYATPSEWMSSKFLAQETVWGQTIQSGRGFNFERYVIWVCMRYKPSEAGTITKGAASNKNWRNSGREGVLSSSSYAISSSLFGYNRSRIPRRSHRCCRTSLISPCSKGWTSSLSPFHDEATKCRLHSTTHWCWLTRTHRERVRRSPLIRRRLSSGNLSLPVSADPVCDGQRVRRTTVTEKGSEDCEKLRKMHHACLQFLRVGKDVGNGSQCDRTVRIRNLKLGQTHCCAKQKEPDVRVLKVEAFDREVQRRHFHRRRRDLVLSRDQNHQLLVAGAFSFNERRPPCTRRSCQFLPGRVEQVIRHRSCVPRDRALSSRVPFAVWYEERTTTFVTMVFKVWSSERSSRHAFSPLMRYMHVM